MHPIEENIPYYDNTHLPITMSANINELQNRPKKIDLLHNYLENPETAVIKRLDIEVGYPFDAFNIISPDKNRLVILVDSRDYLLEYDLNQNRAFEISKSGQGPGDIQLPSEMLMHDSFIYVLREDMYISRYDCRTTPCRYDETISLDFHPFSMAYVNEKYAVLGSPAIGGAPGSVLDETEDKNSVHVVDQKGQKISSFGSKYDTENHWMLLRPFVNNGIIRYSSSEHVYILSFPRFPFLYIYDANSLDLKETYEITNFVLGKQSYWPDEGRLRVLEDDFSMLRTLEVLQEDLLLIEVQTNTNYREAESRAYWDREFDYYVASLKSKESFYIGGYKNQGELPVKYIYLTEAGVTVYNEEDGSLSLVTD